VTGKNDIPSKYCNCAAAVGLVGKESDLFRFTVKHSFIMLFIISLLTSAQAYVIPWIVPEYKQLESAVATEVASTINRFFYLTILFIVLVIITGTVVIMNKRKATRLNS
jgi:lactate permease